VKRTIIKTMTFGLNHPAHLHNTVIVKEPNEP
jgi:hypothetical protein